jgi:hypothetical protein
MTTLVATDTTPETTPTAAALAHAAEWLQQALIHNVGHALAEQPQVTTRTRLMAAVAYRLCVFDTLPKLTQQIIADIADADDGDLRGHDATIARQAIDEFTGRLFSLGAAAVPGYYRK